MNTVNDLIKQLESLREDFKELPIKIICQNGLRVYPEIKMFKNSENLFDDDVEVSEIILTWS